MLQKVLKTRLAAKLVEQGDEPELGDGLVLLQSYVAKFLATFKEYPPRQEAASFTVDQVMKQLKSPGRNEPNLKKG
jgi:hypothetical protein